MKTSELRKLIREEARKVIAANKNKSNKVHEGIFDTMMKALSQKVKLDGTILTKPESKAPLEKLEKAVKGKPETFTAYVKMAKQMGVDLVQNIEKVKEAVVYAFTKNQFNNWIAGSYTGIYDPKTFEFSLVPASAGANAMTSEAKSLKEAKGKAYALVIDEDGKFLMPDLMSYGEESYLNMEDPTKMSVNKVPNYPNTVDAWANAPGLSKSQDAKWKAAVTKLGTAFDYYDVIMDGGENAVIAAIPKGAKISDFIYDEEGEDSYPWGR